MQLVAVFGFFVVMVGVVRMVSTKYLYGAIEAEFPILSSPVRDISYHRFSEKPRKRISQYTTMIVLTHQSFFFGDVRAFSTELHDVRKRFEIPHVNGEPQLGTMIDWIRKWQKERLDKQSIRPDGIAILVPTEQIPMAIVMQVIEQLKTEKAFERVVLGGGLE